MFWVIFALILLQLLLWVPFCLHFSWKSSQMQGQLHAQLRFLGLCLADYSLQCGLLPLHRHSALAILGMDIPLKNKKAKQRKSGTSAKWSVRPRLKVLDLSVRLGIEDDAAATALMVGTLRSMAGAFAKKNWHLNIQPDFQKNCLLADAHGIFCLSLGKILSDRIRRR